MSKYTAQNQSYHLTSTECILPPTVEKSRTAARIIAWSRRHYVRWKAPFEDIAQRYMLLLNSPRREQAYINAATRAFDKASIDDLTTDFIAAFNITGRDIHDLLGSETYPETTWQILPGDAAPVIWPLERLTSTNEKVEDFCRIVNAALETSGLSISASFAAMLYVTLLSDDSGLKSAVDNSLEVLDYKGVSDARLGELGVTLNKAGITVDSALSHWLQRKCISTSNPMESPVSRVVPAYASVSVVTPRNTRLSAEARVRDKHRCLLSKKTHNVQVYHLVAYSIGQFWRFVAMLVGEEGMLKIRAYVIGESENGALINRLENCICLSSDLHALFNDGAFILELLDEDERSPMRVDVSKFCEPAVPAEYSVRYTKVAGLVEPLVRRGSSIHNLSVNDIPASSLEDDAILAFNPVYDVVQKRELQNSEIIRFKTDNPDTHPLPHPHLLWLHANISRVVRMAGRTGEYEYASEFDPELEEEEL
ncbi:hypothetical protein AOL_s00215g69 [Orbilia oligospora ATCC 24927]|uniref:HNH nuclease domain-containing protein n=1 Tax=Arthrobotrys oligospora (strain ATCC 24927 / CBS 115.81 / DSM 1491) TaxID=756982 RepID=G1XTE0_ARTOA|nr:hypothetical protein AOL_s00215g69 [Orbilia oligospora ATCC 24927]EGX43333.1 hypothetical protein AOL_s00215g69 [Orbilia oligospora ATCC 24927]